MELCAVTGPDYGRIYDHELVCAVMRLAGNGTGDALAGRCRAPSIGRHTAHNPFDGHDRAHDHALRRGPEFSCSWSTIPTRSRPAGCPMASPDLYF